jgi:WD40 repeat protein
MTTPSKDIRLLVERYEDAWEEETPPDIRVFAQRAVQEGAITEDAATLRTLVIELIRVDLEYRWREWTSKPGAASDLLLEAYARKLPLLGPSDAWPQELIVAEYKARKRWGDNPDLAATLSRFPSHREVLLPTLEMVDAELASSAQELPSANPVIDGYEILSELGDGGFGIVYKARPADGERPVAIKVLRPAAKQNQKAVDRFKTEARAISKLDHDHIVRILQIGLRDEPLFLVLEYLEGGTLFEKMAGRPLSPMDAARIAESLADALEEAHKAEVVHRDLTPRNVLFDGKGRPKITDFGLARLGDVQQTRSHEVLGTPPYMSPEQAQGKTRELTFATDIYSLGAILYEMLTGGSPFRGFNAATILKQVIENTPRSIRALNKDVPADLITICNKCLEKTPSSRFSSAAAARDELQRFLRGEPLTIRPPRMGERLAKWARRKPVLASVYGLAALALLLSGLTIGVGLLWRAAESAREQIAIEQGLTDQARQEAEHLRTVAEDQSRHRYRLEHLAATRLLPRLWTEGSYFEMPALLDELKPSDKNEDLRGFEWHYWKRIADDLRLVKVHEDAAFALAVSPKSSIAATGGLDRKIHLWDLNESKQIQTLLGHKQVIVDLAFAADGKSLASVATDVDHPQNGSEIKLWEVDSGKLIASAKLPREVILCVAQSPDGKRLLTGGGGMNGFSGPFGAVRVWDPTTLKQVHTPLKCKPLVQRIACDPDSSRFATGSSPSPNDPGELILWNVDTWREEKRFGPQTKGIWGVVFTPDSSRLLSCGIDGVGHVWNIANGSEEGKLEGHTFNINHIDVRSDGNRAATASFDGTVKLWDLTTKKELATLRGHAGFVLDVRYCNDGRSVVSAGLDGTLRRWDATQGEAYATTIPSQKAEFTKVIFSPDGTLIAWTSGSKAGKGEVGVWDIRSKQVIFTHSEQQNAFFSPAFSHDGKHLAFGTGQNGRKTGGVQIWNWSQSKLETKITAEAFAVQDLVYGKDDEIVIGACMDGPLKIWNAKDGKVQRVLRGHRLNVFAIAINRDGTLLASGAGKYQQSGGELKIWDLALGTERAAINDLTDGVSDLAFSPDGLRLVAGNLAERATVWDVAGLKRVMNLSHERMAPAVAFSADGRRIATASYDGTLAVWEAATGQRLLRLKASKVPVSSVAFSPEGLLLVSGCQDGEIKMWNTSPPSSDRETGKATPE